MSNMSDEPVTLRVAYGVRLHQLTAVPCAQTHAARCATQCAAKALRGEHR